MDSYVVAGINIPRYTQITDAHLELKKVPPGEVPEEALRVQTRAVGRLAKNAIMAGETVTEENLYAFGEAPTLADDLPPGYRAVTVSVDAKSALNGMIYPGVYVDISMTVTNDHPQVGGLATLTVIQNVQVLATSETRYPITQGRPGELRSVTLAVTPEQSNRLILAQRYGTLSVTLCSNLGDAIVGIENDGKNLVNPFVLLGVDPPGPEPIPVIQRKTAEIWRGSQRTKLVFGASEIQEALAATEAGKDCDTCGGKKKASKEKAAQEESRRQRREEAEAKGLMVPTPAPPRPNETAKVSAPAI
jgi:pilus assembly protein CpaB